MTVLEVRKYTLSCDSLESHDDHPAAFFQHAVAYAPRAAVIEAAVAAGWTHVRSGKNWQYDQDYCPQHRPGPE
jgi:hypothetical protein